MGTVHGVAKSQTRLSKHLLAHSHTCIDEFMRSVSSHFGKGKPTKVLSNEALTLFPVFFFFLWWQFFERTYIPYNSLI